MLLSLFCFFFLLVGTIRCVPPFVYNTADGGASCANPTYDDVQAAIDAASSGDTLVVCCGLHFIDADITLLRDDMVLRGEYGCPGDALPVLKFDEPCVNIDVRAHRVTVAGLDIRKGLDPSGCAPMSYYAIASPVACVTTYVGLTVTNCTIRDNWNGILVRSRGPVRIESNNFYNLERHAIEVSHSANSLFVGYNNFYDWGQHGVSVKPLAGCPSDKVSGVFRLVENDAHGGPATGDSFLHWEHWTDDSDCGRIDFDVTQTNVERVTLYGFVFENPFETNSWCIFSDILFNRVTVREAAAGVLVHFSPIGWNAVPGNSQIKVHYSQFCYLTGETGNFIAHEPFDIGYSLPAPPSATLGMFGDVGNGPCVCFGDEYTYELSCSGHGRCLGDDYCECENLWEGQRCGRPTECEHVCFGDCEGEVDVCSGHGTCVGWDCCDCDDGWYGPDCSWDYLPHCPPCGRGHGGRRPHMCRPCGHTPGHCPACPHPPIPGCHPCHEPDPPHEEKVCNCSCREPTGAPCHGQEGPCCPPCPHEPLVGCPCPPDPLNPSACEPPCTCECVGDCECPDCPHPDVPGCPSCGPPYHDHDCDCFDPCSGPYPDHPPVRPGHCLPCPPPHPCPPFKCCDVDPQSPYVCHTRGHCVGPDHCICQPGFWGPCCGYPEPEFMCYDKYPWEQRACCGHGDCTGQDFCECHEGWHGEHCCDCVNPISCYGYPDDHPDVCCGHGECAGDNMCMCDLGWEGPECCDEIPPHTCWGKDPGDSDVCCGHGACRGQDFCSCSPDWVGPECCDRLSCNEILPDDPRVCSGHGRCVGHDQCDCDPGYFGMWCQEILSCDDFYFQDPRVCSGHGRCVDEDVCNCAPHWEGLWCQDEKSCDDYAHDDPMVCNGHGTCSEENECVCDPHYYGDWCQDPLSCNDVLASEEYVCNGHGVCTAMDTCVCQNDWFGMWCDQPPDCFGIVYWEPEVCSSHGVCVGPDHCICHPQWEGVECDHPTTCRNIPAVPHPCWDPEYEPPPFVCPPCPREPIEGCDPCPPRPPECPQCPHPPVPGCPPCILRRELPPDHPPCHGHGGCDDPVHPPVHPCHGHGGCHPHRPHHPRPCPEKPPCGHPPCEPCSGHGECVGYDQCNCSEGWGGQWCDMAITNITCFDFPSNDPEVCCGHGKCLSDDHCDCLHGWFGEQCCDPQYTCCGKHPDAHDVCSGNGVCKHQDDCWCFYGYSGPECEEGEPEPYECFGKMPNDPDVCCGHGICTAYDVCDCNPGWGEKRRHPMHGHGHHGVPCVEDVGECQEGCEEAWDDACHHTCDSGEELCHDTCDASEDECHDACEGLEGAAEDECHGACDMEEEECHGACDLAEGECDHECREGLASCLQDCADGSESCHQGHHGHGPDHGNHHPHLNCSKEQCCHNIQPHMCFGYWPKDPRSCSGHGWCHDWDLCYCERGWEGEMCEIENPVDECHGVEFDDPEVCYGHGECEEGVCTCDEFWTGAFCQIYLLQCCKSTRTIRYCVRTGGVAVTGLSAGWSLVDQFSLDMDGFPCEHMVLQRVSPGATMYPTLNVTAGPHDLSHELSQSCLEYGIFVPGIVIWPIVALVIVAIVALVVLWCVVWRPQTGRGAVLIRGRYRKKKRD